MSHIVYFSIPILPTFITVDLILLSHTLLHTHTMQELSRNGCVQYCQLLPHQLHLIQHQDLLHVSVLQQQTIDLEFSSAGYFEFVGCRSQSENVLFKAISAWLIARGSASPVSGDWVVGFAGSDVNTSMSCSSALKSLFTWQNFGFCLFQISKWNSC